MQIFSKLDNSVICISSTLAQKYNEIIEEIFCPFKKKNLIIYKTFYYLFYTFYSIKFP